MLADATVYDLQSSYEQRAFQRDRPLIAQHSGVVIRRRRRQDYSISETDPLTSRQTQLLEAFELQDFL